jgi:hypothetical protein
MKYRSIRRSARLLAASVLLTATACGDDSRGHLVDAPLAVDASEPTDAPVDSSAPDANDVESCDPAEHSADSAEFIAGRCAYFYNTAVTWLDADAACHARGMRLIAIGSPEEDEQVTDWIALHQNATWIGLNDRTEEGTFVWSLGGGQESSTPTYRPADKTYVNTDENDCIVILTLDRHWHMLTCEQHYRAYICTPQ